MVDPDTAGEWLGRNYTNRSVKPRRVAQYARDMARGDWHMTGEPIKFTADGTMIDGQHRCYAVRRSGATVPMLVVEGLQPDAQSYMDTGTARTAGDALSLQGEGHAGTLAATARLGLAIDRGQKTGTSAPTPSHAEVFDWIEANPTVRDAVAYGHSRNGHDVPFTATTLAYCFFRLSAIDAEDATEFLDGMASGANLSLGSPQLAVRDRAFKIREEKRPVRNVDVAAMVIKAWNTWRKGRATKSVLVPQPGSDVPWPR